MSFSAKEPVNTKKSIQTRPFTSPTSELRTSRLIRCTSAHPIGQPRKGIQDDDDDERKALYGFLKFRPQSAAVTSIARHHRSINPSAIERGLDTLCNPEPAVDLTRKSIFTLARERELTERMSRAASAPPDAVNRRNLEVASLRASDGDARRTDARCTPAAPPPPLRVRATSPHLLVSRRDGLTHVVAHRVPLKEKLDRYRRDPRALRQLQRRIATPDGESRRRGSVNAAAGGGGGEGNSPPLPPADRDHVRRNIENSVAGVYGAPQQSELLRLRALEAVITAELHRAARRRLLSDDISRTQVEPAAAAAAATARF